VSPRRSLPGADKYRRPRTSTDAPWEAPVVLLANREVSVIAVLNDYFRTHIPIDAEGWKTYCPFAREHEDGGIDKQFRVYHSSNSGHCFALHGTLDPVRLWRQRRPYGSLTDAAQDLLDTYGVEYRRKPWRERWAELHEAPEETGIDAKAVVAAFTTWLNAQPDYLERQYDEDVLLSVNFVLSRVHGVCAQATTIGEVESWLARAKTVVTTVCAAPLRPPRARPAPPGATSTSP
jgi:hypothetical protein